MISSIETSPRERFWFSVASSTSSDDPSRRSWSLRAFRFATRTVRSCDDSWASPELAGLGAQLDDDEQAEDQGDGRDRDLAAGAMHRQPPGPDEADGDGAGEAIGRE